MSWLDNFLLTEITTVIPPKHHAEVVSGRRAFKFTVIQRKISLSLSNWLSFASKSLCKN